MFQSANGTSLKMGNFLCLKIRDFSTCLPCCLDVGWSIYRNNRDDFPCTGRVYCSQYLGVKVISTSVSKVECLHRRCQHRRSEVSELQRQALSLFYVLYPYIFNSYIHVGSGYTQVQACIAFFTEMLTNIIPGKVKIGLPCLPLAVMLKGCGSNGKEYTMNSECSQVFTDRVISFQCIFSGLRLNTKVLNPSGSPPGEANNFFTCINGYLECQYQVLLTAAHFLICKKNIINHRSVHVF